MKSFKFGQLVARGDLCDRKNEVKMLAKVCQSHGRAVVYGPRRYGKTSVVKNVVIEDFLAKDKKSLALYVDLFQLESLEDFVARLRTALEQALSQRAKIKSIFEGLQNYLKNFRVEVSADPLSGAPTVSLAGQHVKKESSLTELFQAIRNFKEYRVLLVLDEFQDITLVGGLEARLRSEIQTLNHTAVIVLGSRRHLLREIFHEESRPFYGFGIDVEFKAIPVQEWAPFLQERFASYEMTIQKEGVEEITRLMRDVPNSIQELCQWIALESEPGELSLDRIHQSLVRLIENKSSRYRERLASLSAKEKLVLAAIAQMEPVASIASTAFLKITHVSATATRATIMRLLDQGVLDESDLGYSLTDPLFAIFLKRQVVLGRS